MKRIISLGLLALGILCAADQQASAWVNSKFGVGLNWSWQGGGNNLLWGAIRGGTPPCPENGPYGAPGFDGGFGGYGGGYGPGFGGGFAAPQSYAGMAGGPVS